MLCPINQFFLKTAWLYVLGMGSNFRWPNLFANYLKIVLLSRLKHDRNFWSTEKYKFRSKLPSVLFYVLLTKILSTSRSPFNFLTISKWSIFMISNLRHTTISYSCLVYNHLWVFLTNFNYRNNIAIKTSSTMNVLNKFVSFLF